MMSVVDPLTKVEAGLKGTGDKPIPLQAVDIKARLLDLAAQVTNTSPRFSQAFKCCLYHMRGEDSMILRNKRKKCCLLLW